MKNIESNYGNSENINAEWALLKEMSNNRSDRFLMDKESQLDKAERDKQQRRGRMLLNIVNRMPNRLDMDEKANILNRIHQSAEMAGIGDALDNTLMRKMHPILNIEKRIFKGGMPELSAEEESKIEVLREKVVDLTEVDAGALRERFPSGNFLYHGSTVEKIGKIFETGGIKNGIAIVEDDPNANAFGMNSGFEGISWSMNAIDALPGDRGHIAGFLAAPEDILSDDGQLVIPSRPAPYEVLQVAKEINPEELYTLKKQVETWGTGGVRIGEMNCIDSNIMAMHLYKEGDSILGHSKVYEYDGDISADTLRQYYKIDDKKVTFDEDMFQKNEIPPALPWFQSLIDRGFFREGTYAGLDSVDKIIDHARADSDFRIKLLAAVKKQSQPVVSAYEEALGNAKALRIKPEDTYFVTSHQDLDDWLKVMAKTGVEPKGILLYDDNKVVMSNFASEYEGNQKELGDEIGKAVGVNTEFWREEMGFDPQDIPRSGSVGQVLLDSAVKHNKSLSMENGRLKVEDWSSE